MHKKSFSDVVGREPHFSKEGETIHKLSNLQQVPRKKKKKKKKKEQ